MAVEIVIFHLQPTVTNPDFLTAIDETTAWLKTQKGFVSRTVGRAESGEWLDILFWESVEDAKAAAALFQANPAGKRLSEYLDPQGLQVFYLETVAKS